MRGGWRWNGGMRMLWRRLGSDGASKWVSRKGGGVLCKLGGVDEVVHSIRRLRVAYCMRLVYTVREVWSCAHPSAFSAVSLDSLVV